MSLLIRTAIFSDIPILSNLAEETFYAAWAAYNTSEDMALFTQQHFSHNVLQKEIAEPNSFFLLAFSGNIVAGYCKVKENNSKKELNNIKCAELEKLYVKKEFQNIEIGQKLLNEACKKAKSNFDVMWLSVWKPNIRAIKFYERNGFRIFGEQQFLLGKDVQYDFVMSKNL